MKRITAIGLAAAAWAAAPAHATVQIVDFDRLVASAVLETPFAAGDRLVLDSFAAGQRGWLEQSITFTLDTALQASGSASWSVVPRGSRLYRVDIDVLDADGQVVLSDSFAGRAAGLANSVLAGSLGPGTYTLRATGWGGRDASLDLSMAFAVPEPASAAMMAAGLGLITLVAARRRRQR